MEMVKILPSLLVALSIIAGSAHATQGKSRRSPSHAEEQKPTVIGLEPGLDLSPFRDGNYEVYDRPTETKSEVPKAEDRDGLFARCGFSKEDFRGWDQLALDMLYLQAKGMPAASVKELHPSLPLKKIECLGARLREKK